MLEDLANVGEFVGAVAVVVTLIYLAFQSKQANVFMVRQIRQSVTDSAMSLLSVGIQNPEINVIAGKHIAGEELTSGEQRLMRTYLMMFMQLLKNNYYHYRAGLITEEDWEGMLGGYSPLISTPIFRDLVENMGIGKSENFGLFLKELIDER